MLSSDENALVVACQGADLLIAECYFHDKPVRMHLDYATLAAHRHELEARRIVLTHMSAQMLGKVDSVAEKCARDGLVLEVGAGALPRCAPPRVPHPRRYRCSSRMSRSRTISWRETVRGLSEPRHSRAKRRLSAKSLWMWRQMSPTVWPANTVYGRSRSALCPGILV